MENENRFMNSSCACKGIRSCLVCEQSKKTSVKESEVKAVYHYCVPCQKAYLGVDHKHPDHGSVSIEFPGVHISEEFIDETVEKSLAHHINQIPWVDSQSGRRKQDFGPKVNFKKQKVKIGTFSGLPKFSEKLIKQIQTLPVLADFYPVEQCHLEYCPERGSGIDPHFDDFWLWGERLVTLNLLSDTILRMTCDRLAGIEVCLPLRRRSLIVLSGPARYEWKHAIHRDDITDTRLAITIRELTKEFLQGGKNEILGSELLKIAESFNGKSIGES